MTEAAYPLLGKAEEIFKLLAWDTMVKAALVYLKLDFWPLNSIAKVFTDKLFDLLKSSFDLQVIVFVNAQHKKAYDDATIHLKVVAYDYGTDSPQFKEAKENAKAALSKFVRFGAV